MNSGISRAAAAVVIAGAASAQSAMMHIGADNAGVGMGDGYTSINANPARLRPIAEGEGMYQLMSATSIRMKEDDNFMRATRQQSAMYDEFNDDLPASAVSPEYRQAFFDELEALDGQQMQTEINSIIALKIGDPSTMFPLALTITERAIVAMKFNFDPEDRNRYTEDDTVGDITGVDTGDPTPGDDGGSHMDFNLVGVLDLGLGTSVTFENGLSFGARLKWQRLDILNRDLVREDKDDPQMEKYHTTHRRVTADAGFEYKYKNWHVGIMARDMGGTWNQLSEQGQYFEMRQQAVFGFGYDDGVHAGAVEAASHVAMDFGLIQGVKPLLIQYEYRPNAGVLFQAKIRKDKIGPQDTTLALGVEYNTWRKLRVSAGAELGKEGTEGLTLGISYEF